MKRKKIFIIEKKKKSDFWEVLGNLFVLYVFGFICFLIVVFLYSIIKFSYFTDVNELLKTTLFYYSIFMNIFTILVLAYMLKDEKEIEVKKPVEIEEP